VNSTILLFEGGDELDVLGPFELVGNAANAGADVTTTLRTVDGSERATASHGLDVGAYLPNDAVWTVHGADSLTETSAVWLFVFEGENVHTRTAPVAGSEYTLSSEARALVVGPSRVRTALSAVAHGVSTLLFAAGSVLVFGSVAYRSALGLAGFA
jgi:hypothetical protein